MGHKAKFSDPAEELIPVFVAHACVVSNGKYINRSLSHSDASDCPLLVTHTLGTLRGRLRIDSRFYFGVISAEKRNKNRGVIGLLH